MMLEVVATALTWGFTAVRLPTLWRGRRQRTMWVIVFVAAVTQTALLPPVAAWLGMPILPQLLGVVMGYLLLRFAALLSGRGYLRRPAALTVAALVALVILADLSGGIDTAAPALNGNLPGTAVAYWVLMEVFLGAALLTVAPLFWRVARDAPAGLPRLGLRAIAVGQVVVALYAVDKAALIVAHRLGAPVDFTAIEPVATAVQAVGTLLAVGGALVPATRRTRSAAGAYRSLLVLRPLWKAMHDAFPEVILFTPRRAVIELAGVDDVHLRLYRRVIEIRDGMLALRPYLTSPGVAGDPAVAEATAIALALRRRAAGEPPADHDEGWAPVGPEMADEVAWLSRVSTAYRRLPVTPAAAAPIPRPSGSVR
jgi:uncharacterized protein DUF6545